MFVKLSICISTCPHGILKDGFMSTVKDGKCKVYTANLDLATIYDLSGRIRTIRLCMLN